jgi:hypothetical protein
VPRPFILDIQANEIELINVNIDRDYIDLEEMISHLYLF